MADQRPSLRQMPDDDLAQALRSVAAAVVFPSAAAPGRPDIATRVRARLLAEPPARPARLSGLRPVRRSLVLALAALLILAAVVGAVGLGLPGIRIIFGDVPTPPPSPTSGQTRSPSPSARPGAFLGLGTAVPLAEAERLAGLDVLLPTDPPLGEPDATYFANGRVALVWASSPELPEVAPGVGLVVNEFLGTMDQGYFQKILGAGTRLTRVTVDGSPGWWISGESHFFFYVDPSGVEIEDSHRVVGDTLIWTKGDVTYRVETSIGMEAALRLAESLE